MAVSITINESVHNSSYEKVTYSHEIKRNVPDEPVPSVNLKITGKYVALIKESLKMSPLCFTSVTNQ